MKRQRLKKIRSFQLQKGKIYYYICSRKCLLVLIKGQILGSICKLTTQMWKFFEGIRNLLIMYLLHITAYKLVLIKHPHAYTNALFIP